WDPRPRDPRDGGREVRLHRCVRRDVGWRRDRRAARTAARLARSRRGAGAGRAVPRVAGVQVTPVARPRCAWCGDDPLYVRYHDEEWGVPVVDEVRLFEKLSL